MLTADRIAKIKHLALADAAKKRNDAGYSGSWSDGGANAIEDAVRVWEAGLEQRIPKKLKEYDKRVELEADKDYKLYLELKKRYEK